MRQKSSHKGIPGMTLRKVPANSGNTARPQAGNPGPPASLCSSFVLSESSPCDWGIYSK